MMRLFVTALIICWQFDVFAQQSNVPLNYEWLQETEAKMVEHRGFNLSVGLMNYSADTSLSSLYDSLFYTSKRSDEVTIAYPIHSGMRPWIEQGHALRHNVSAHNTFQRRTTYNKTFGSWVRQYYSWGSLLQVEKPATYNTPLFRLYINPLIHAQSTTLLNDTSTERLYINTRGVTARGDIGTKISFETTFIENQAFLPAWQDSFAMHYGVIPGQGRWKRFKQTGYDYASAFGTLSYSPFRLLNIQIGNDKLFVGDGIRSLLWSDRAFNFPHARITLWSDASRILQYTMVYASLMNLTAGGVTTPPGTERLFQKKPAAFQHLSVRIGRFGQIGLFQGLIWNRTDSTNRQSLNFHYFNPVIFSSLPAFGLGDTVNYLIGVNYRFNIIKRISVYGQFMLDEFSGSKQLRSKGGLQVGLKYFNAFFIPHLHVQVEYNQVRPFAYSCRDSLQAWTHYNQSIAHPLGANFKEWLVALQYKIGPVFLHARYSSAEIGANGSNVNNGQNPLWSDNFPGSAGPYTIGSGVSGKLVTADVQLGMVFNHATNLNLSVGYNYRNRTYGSLEQNNGMIYVTFRTSLFNLGHDYF
jgi:hypothetical protein